MTAAARPSQGRVAAALGIVYLVWGSTYLAIRYAIEAVPPFLMAGSRFLVAGAILYAHAVREGGPAPTRRQWLNALSIGVLLLTLGNGLVSWAELRVPSGLAALLVAAMPVWMVLIDAARPGGRGPTGAVIAGIVLGLVGQVVLVGPQGGGKSVSLIGVAALLVATCSWAAGSIRARLVDLPASRIRTSAMEMLAGGAVLLVVGLIGGEARGFYPSAVSLRSLLAWSYLVVFGSLIAFSAFVWLNSHVAAAKVATYAYVNPVVAVFLGWLIAGETVTLRTVVAAAIILGAVMMINLAGERAARSARVVGSPQLRTDS